MQGNEALKIVNPEPMTATEAERLSSHEAVIERGLTTFAEVGNALLAIRDEKLYRASHGTFEEYCREKWSLSVRRGYQLIEAARVVESVKNFSHSLPPSVESHAKPLTVLPKPEQQAEAWEEAVARTNGKPTAKAVQEAVERRMPPKPAPALKPEPVIVEPPAPRGFKPIEIHDPGPIEPEPELTWEPGAGPDEDRDDTDEGYLESLPVRAKLNGQQRKIFDSNALFYRRMESHRKTYQHHAVRELNVLDKRRRGPYAYEVVRFLKLDGPAHWILCPAPEHGGCGGTGVVPRIGECPACFGRGFRIK